MKNEIGKSPVGPGGTDYVWNGEKYVIREEFKNRDEHMTRNPYHWGLKTRLLSMKVSDVLAFSKEDAYLYSLRSTVSVLKKQGFGIWKVTKTNDKFLVIRIHD